MSRHDPGLDADTVQRLLTASDPYLSCDECFRRMDQYVEQRLADPHHDDVAMATHLLACGACAEEADALAELLSEDAGAAD